MTHDLAEPTARSVRRAAHRPLRGSDVLTALLLCAASVSLTWSSWVAAVGMVRTTQSLGCVVVAVLAAAWLGWVRRFRWRVCRVHQRVAGLYGIGAGAALARGGNGSITLMLIGAVLLIIGSVALALGTQFIFRFGPVLWVLALMVGLVWAQWMIERYAGGTERAPLLFHLARLISEATLIAYLYAFVTPLYPAVRLAVVLASPLVALVAGLLAPALYKVVNPIARTHPAHAASDTLALIVVLAAAFMTARLARRGLLRTGAVQLGPFMLTRI